MLSISSKPARASKSRALIIDRHAVMGIEVCRKLAAQGCWVEVFGHEMSPAFRSRYCHVRLPAPPWQERARYLSVLRDTVENGNYNEIYLCSEEVLELILPVLDSHPAWRALLLPKAEFLKMTFSKSEMVELAMRLGVPVPRTMVPSGAGEAASVAREMGFPVVVKGDKGESAQNVRFARNDDELRRLYGEVAGREAAYGGKPAVQEFVPGLSYVVAGLFDHGRPLRICCHRKVFSYPASGGNTVKGITERHEDLLESAFRIFEALEYTGLAALDFLRDESTGKFKFLEINPRIWARVGMAHYAGVDLFTPYRTLVKGLPVEGDLRFREGVQYHWLLGEFKVIAKRPLRIFGLIKDLLDPRSRFDFLWSDPRPFTRGPADLRRLFGRRPAAIPVRSQAR